MGECGSSSWAWPRRCCVAGPPPSPGLPGCPSLADPPGRMPEPLLGLAQALLRRQSPPDPGAFQAALQAFISDTEGLRSDALVQKLPGETFGQVFALGFAF